MINITSLIYKLGLCLSSIMHRKGCLKCPLKITSEIQTFIACRNEFTMSDWLELEILINHVQNGFTKRLRKIYPMLTEDDIHVILLLRSNMEHAHIARILHVQMSSFRMRRSRLKKKMKIKKYSFSDAIKTLYL